MLIISNIKLYFPSNTSHNQISNVIILEIVFFFCFFYKGVRLIKIISSYIYIIINIGMVIYVGNLLEGIKFSGMKLLLLDLWCSEVYQTSKWVPEFHLSGIIQEVRTFLTRPTYLLYRTLSPLTVPDSITILLRKKPSFLVNYCLNESSLIFTFSERISKKKYLQQYYFSF